MPTLLPTGVQGPLQEDLQHLEIVLQLVEIHLQTLQQEEAAIHLLPQGVHLRQQEAVHLVEIVLEVLLQEAHQQEVHLVEATLEVQRQEAALAEVVLEVHLHQEEINLKNILK